MFFNIISSMSDNDKTIKVDNELNEVLECMMVYNGQNQHIDQLFISPASLTRFASEEKKMQLFNRKPHNFGYKCVVRVLESNADLIDAHHEKYKLDSTHNAKMGNLKKYSKKSEVILDSSKQDNSKKQCSYFKPRTIAEEIEDRELMTSINQDLEEKFKEYRELVQSRKLKKAKSRKEPEIYHHFKKREN